MPLRTDHLYNLQNCNHGKSSGDAGYRSRYLSHAKRALYHLSYTPLIPCEKMLFLNSSEFLDHYRGIGLVLKSMLVTPKKAKLRNINSKPNSREGSTKLPRLYPPMYNRNNTIYAHGIHHI